MLPLVNLISNAVDDCVHEFNPTLNIFSVDQPYMYVTAPSDDCFIMVLQTALPDDLREVDEIVNVGRVSPPTNHWDVDTVVDVAVGDKVWTVNSALVDGGLWDVPFVTNPGIPFEEAAAQDPAFWEGLVMEDLEKDLALGQGATAMVASVDKGKRKLGDVPVDLWDSDGMSSLWDVANVTMSGRVFQPVNLQDGSSSNPLAQRPNVPATQRNAPFTVLIIPSGAPEDDIIKKQLDQIPVAISIKGLICSSKEHCEKLSSILAHVKVPNNITPEAMIALILPLIFKPSVTFTERELPVEGVAHNRPLHIIVKCRGH
ncbi:hypothetical protein RHMOL_Rhmol11G0041600 [Rhododendron molle]|uniref:Uncharacterized protein n=1 Tax=Rhododendron molle TaxID=49168 RepID=A0ACC0LQ40_RHOML|nr:hypothetical protein RHMOL_Rhmol11G0041600 [Rhododendron molle]